MSQAKNQAQTMFQFSSFSQTYRGDSGTIRLMDDLGQFTGRDDIIMLGGGNPSHIPAIQEYFRHAMGRVLDSDYDFETLISNYSAPGGDRAFVAALVDLFNTHYGWGIGPEHIALTNGSQTAFFFLFNMFAGRFPDGTQKKILLPLAPEYIGYEDAGIEGNIFTSRRPAIEQLDGRLFKYHVDFDALAIDERIGAICVSRPTNPTGNVLTEAEIDRLAALAEEHHIPLIIDNAYGAPFPGIIHTETTPRWNPQTVMCMSLSKLGLPGARTGIIIAAPEIISTINGMNAIISLAPGSFGAFLAGDAVRSGDILRMSDEIIRPHYARKAQHAVDLLLDAIPDPRFRIHRPEGAFFLWLWFQDLPITCQELYDRLKARGVIILPGHYFFPGLEGEWRHRHECIRMSYAGPDAKVEQGIRIIAEEVARAYAG